MDFPGIAQGPSNAAGRAGSVTAIAIFLAACGGSGSSGSSDASSSSGASGGSGPPTGLSSTIGGTVSGLASGTSLVLQDNGGDSLTVSSNSNFVFATAVVYPDSYSVTVQTQPAGQYCSVSMGTGTVTVGDITNVVVHCSPIPVLSAHEMVVHSFYGAANTQTPGTQAGGLAGTTYTTYPAPFYPPSLILGSDGNLYGVTSLGGANIGGYCASGESKDYILNEIEFHTDCTYYTAGTVFEVTPDGVETALWTFGKEPDGGAPTSIIQGRDGNFYGTTGFGGSGSGASYTFGNGNGTVFEVTSDGVETILYRFDGSVSDAQSPTTLIQGTDGNFYGTTQNGGPLNQGTLFKVTPSGIETIPWFFYADNSGLDGDGPTSLIQASDGNFYGTTAAGGGSVPGFGKGTVFKITPGGSETILWSFGSGADGFGPAALIQASDGSFYGVTRRGGTYDAGTVFRVTPAGTETVLWNFGGPGDGSAPAGLIQGRDGNFYGTTSSGGLTGAGTVFRLTPSGVESVVWIFGLDNDDGVNPSGSLIQDSAGNLYGITLGGADPNATAVVNKIYKITL